MPISGFDHIAQKTIVSDSWPFTASTEMISYFPQASYMSETTSSAPDYTLVPETPTNF
ncbi:hypothetical protein F2Q68_00034771 [Brassica cretica]|nr:hypothetical protein F2Q68_00034771 [Brassica cretica]